MEPATRSNAMSSKSAGKSKPAQPSPQDRRAAFETSTRLGLVRKALRQS